MVNAILYQARTGCQWRYVPSEFGPWNTIWRTFARWRDRGVWQEAMDVLRRRVRRLHGRLLEPSMLMVDGPVIKGGCAGPSFHQYHGKCRLNGTNRVIAVDYLGLLVGACVVGARRHEVAAVQDLLDDLLPDVPRVRSVLGDRGLRGLGGPLLGNHDVVVEIKHRDRLPGEFKPIRPLWRVEGAFCEIGRWRRLARSFEATAASAWMQVGCVGWLLTFNTNAGEIIAARGQACETAWRHVGAPPLVRAKPRLQRRKQPPDEDLPLTA